MRIFTEALLSIVCFGILSGHADASSVLGSKHDFSSLGISPCGYCHSVHNALGGMGLINPGFGTFPSITKVYSTSTRIFNADIASINKSDAPLCLACHDQNSTNSNPYFKIVKERFDIRGGTDIYIGTDLSNDHPIGFTFDPSLSPAKIKEPVKAHVTYGPGGRQMWCSTCHDVHNNEFGNFLVMPNTGSALCLDCHIK